PGTPGGQPVAITANSVTIARYDTGVNGGNLVLIDRLDHDATTDTSLRRLDDVVTGDQEFELAGEWTDTQIGPLDTQDHFVDLVRTNADDLNGSDVGLLVQWIRATRAWAADIPDGWGWPNQTYDGWERNPRFVFSQHDLLQSDNTLRVGYYEEDTSQIPPRLNQKWESDPLKGVSVIGWDPDTENPDDQDNDGNPDGVDADLLADAPDPWIVTEVWSPRAGDDLRGLDADGDGTGTDANGFEAPDGLPDGGLRLRKPTYFDMNRMEDPAFPTGWSYPDKGWYGQRDRGEGNVRTASDDPAFEDLDGDGRIGELELPAENLDGDAMLGENERDMPTGFPLQMLQKDGDFDQVGELLNCWLLGHMLEGTYSPVGAADDFLSLGTVNAGTLVTFSEFMMPMSVDDWWAPIVGVEQDYDNDGSVDVVELDARVNRLRFAQDGLLGYPLMPGGTADINGALDYPWPRMSAAARVLDSFVCDGPGRPDTNGDGIGDDLLAADAPIWSFYNANGFNGDATPGLININTAPLEVIRALPHMYKMVHQTDAADAATLDGADRNPRTAVAEAIVQWRENGNGRANVIGGTGITGGPDYATRNFTLGIDTTLPIEETRGFHSPTQIGMLTAPGQVDDVYEPWHLNQQHQAVKDRDAWRIDFAALAPFSDRANTGFWIDGDGDGINDDGVGAHLSTDVVGRPYSGLNTLSGDMVSGDSEEMNLLLSGMSNLITTTSDMFTVHMRIRTFKRNPVLNSWDATDPEYIIDDSRYVMLVDRSHVNHPNDKPTILYFEKLPN
ncbi:MAG: hypothetical protein QGH76_03340, partial [Phycisphaerales bacterium]|nr:hypothetical protein [Phycisphaerales bacterium]